MKDDLAEFARKRQRPALTDKSKMSFGKHKGTPLGEVPASYLLWWHDETDDRNHPLMLYITAKIKQLEQEAEDERRDEDRPEDYDCPY